MSIFHRFTKLLRLSGKIGYLVLALMALAPLLPAIGCIYLARWMDSHENVCRCPSGIRE
jgi:hypothetical protein